MKYINKLTFVLVLGIFLLSSLLINEDLRGRYIMVGFIVIFIGLAILLKRYKCVNLVAGVSGDEEDVEIEKVSRYIGNLAIVVACCLTIMTTVEIFFPEKINLMANFTFIPIIIYIPYCLIKINK